MGNLFLWALACSLLTCQGLEITLNRIVPSPPFSRATCGVLLCVEESQTATNQTQTQVDSDDSGSPSYVASISSLKVFKLEATSTNTNSGGKRRSLLASVTSQQSRLTRVSNGVKVDGRLEAGRATLRLDFAKQEDCLAEYICEAHGKDIGGNLLVSSSHVQQYAREDVDERIHPDLAFGPAMQVLVLVQQLNAKLAVVGSAVDNWEDEMERLKDAVKYDVEAMKTDLSTKTSRLEDKVASLGKDLENKIESVQRDFNTKTDRFGDKMESMKYRLEDDMKYVVKSLERDESGRFDCRKSGLSDSAEEQIKLEVSSIDNKVSKLSENLTKLGADILTSVNDSFIHLSRRMGETNGERLPRNMNHSVQSTTCDNSKDLAGVVNQSLASLKTSLKEDFDGLSSSISLTSTLLGNKTVREHFTVDKIRAEVSDLLTPKDCFKGMSSHLSRSQYLVIESTTEHNLTEPVLCDTFTDGGGWVVIQRRVTGDVNFYRRWADYKQGFGSLDGDFWLGLDNIHAITSSGVYELRVDLRYNGNFAFAHYDSFSVGNERSNYVLSVAHYDGTAGDSLIGDHNGKSFSTHDKDNDTWPNNCAVTYVGGWWYNACHHSNLNGQWKAGEYRGPRWHTFSGANPVSYTEMKIRKVIGKAN